MTQAEPQAASSKTDPIDASRLVDPACYAEHGYPFEEWAWLRRHAPVSKIEAPGFPAYWAITKHADIVEISKQPDAFLNAPGMTIVRERDVEDSGSPPIKTIINMDPPPPPVPPIPEPTTGLLLGLGLAGLATKRRPA